MGKLTPSQLRLGGGLVVAILVLFYTMSSNQHPAATTEKHKSRTTTTAVRQRETAEQPAEPLRQAAPAEADFGRYQAMAERDVFSPPKPPKPKQAKQSLPPLPPKMRQPGVQLAIYDRNGEVLGSRPVDTGPVVQPVRQLTGWSYVGYLKVDDKSYGIMQNDSGNTVSKAEVGADFQGFHVESVNGKEIVLSAGGNRTTLKRPDDFPVLPLGKSAAGQPGMPRPGMRGGG